MKHFALSRREFLKVSIAGGGGMLMELLLPGFALAQTGAMHDTTVHGAGSFKPGVFIRIDRDSTVTVICPNSEMGQGAWTGVAQVIAEELDADWAKVRVEQSPTHPDYARPGLGLMLTGGSNTIRSQWQRFRAAGAAGRGMLLAAAAQEWKIDPAELRTDSGEVIAPDGRRLRYGELAEAAARMPVPEQPPLKKPEHFRIVGQSLPRVDTPAKIDGSAKFGLDVALPGLLTALMARPPVWGSTLKSYDASAAEKVKGVKAVVPISTGVAVAANDFWSAKQGRDALKAQWNEGPLALLSSEDIARQFAAALDRPGRLARKEGDPGAVKPARTVSAEFELPYLAHACMEPMNCTAWVKPNAVEIWAGTQSQTLAQRNAAQVAGVAPEQVQVHTMFLGGGFGRRSVQDFVIAATEISKAVGAPVKLVYTREDDMQSGYFRPYSKTRLSAGLDEKNNLISLQAKVAVPSLAEFTGFRRLMRDDGIDNQAVEGLANWPYAVPSLSIEWVKEDPGVPIWFWRAVGASHNPYVVEVFVDELAQLAGKDPFEYRRALLAKHPRHRAVLELVAEKAGWGTPLPKGMGRGIAIAESFASWVAHVAEVSIESGKVKVHRVVCAIDCGTVVNPGQVAAQMESGIGYGLSAALYGQMTLKNGRVQQLNFDTYPVLRMNEMPKVEVHFVRSSEPPGGVGEPGLPPIAPAVANALFAATGKRIHKLPIDPRELGA